MTTIKKMVRAIIVLAIPLAILTFCTPEEEATSSSVAVTSVSINKNALTLDPGGSESLTATVSPDNATDKTVSWSSSNTSVVTVSGGKVQAVGEGTATITATAGGKTATCSVSVSKKVIAVTSISLDNTEVELENGGTLTLTATVSPDNATYKTVTWISGDENIVTVNDGVIKAIAIGTTTITAKAEDKEITCAVTVVPDQEEKIKSALMKIYDAMDGPNWMIERGWDINKPLNSWSGVVWDEGMLYLNFNGDFGLKGEFPDCFDDLTPCVSFIVQKEPGVTGTLPESFSKLSGLNELILNSTSMTSLPDIFKDMPLKRVAISGNSLMTGSIPETLGGSDTIMEKLSQHNFVFSNNGFTEYFPESWLKFGESLNIYGHRFDGNVPDYLYSSDNPGYWINMYINFGHPNADEQYRDNNPFHVKDVDIPGYWPKDGLSDVVTGETIPYDKIVSSNKATVVFKWGSWCGFSAALLPQLKKMHEKYHDAGLEVIARPAWGDEDGMETHKDYVLKNGYDIWYNVYSNDITYMQEAALGFKKTPFANVIDNKGNIIFSTAPNVIDPRGRFGYVAFHDLIPFLEGIFGPLEDDEVYSSTDYSKDGEVMTLQKATEGKGINIVFMGDAYVDADMGEGGLYEELMTQSMEEFFKIEPYKTFRDRFNVYAVKVVSENGRTGEGYSTALGTTAYGSTISTGLEDKCFEYALMVPGIKDKKNLLIGVLVNSTGLRGVCSMIESLQSGVAYYASASNMADNFGVTIRHEAGGHGFAFLADEYSDNQGSPDQALIDEYNRLYSTYGWFSNVDFTNDPKKVRWSVFLSDERYKDEVGVFEGGCNLTNGVYRPSEDSMMGHNQEYYNAPSRWAIYKRIMELSGETASFDKFLEYDAVNRGNRQSSARFRSYIDWVPDAPPIVRR